MDVINGVLESIPELYKSLKSSVTMDQMMILSAALIVLVIVLLIVLNSRARRLEEALEGKTAEAEPDSTLTEREMRLAKKEEALLRREAELSQSERRYEDPHHNLGQSATSSALLDMASGKLLSEARRQAQELTNKSEREYLEIITRAHDEAEFIRQKANERLMHAHESLRQSIARSGEIIEEAYIEARIASAKPPLIEDCNRPIPPAPDFGVSME